MCPSPKIPKSEPVKVPDPVPEPPAPEPTAEAPVVDEGKSRTAAKSSEGNIAKKGTSSLRIDVNMAQPGGAGLNIPRG